MFEYEGKQYTLDTLQKSATSQGYDNFEEFLEMYKDAGMKQVAESPSVGSNVMGSSLGGGSLEQQEGGVVKDIDTSAAGLFFNVLQETQPATGKALSAMAGFLKGSTDILDNIGDFAETMVEINVEAPMGISSLGIAPYMAKRIAAREAGVSKEEFDETNPYNIIKLKGLSNVLDKAIIKHKDKETGQQLDFIDLFQRAETAEDYAKSAESFVMETAGALPSLIVSRIPGGYAMLGGGAFAEKLNTDLFERPDQTADKILSNALVYGGSDAVGEYFGGRYLNKLGGLVKGGGKEGLNKAKDVMIGGIGAYIKTAFKGGSSEFMQEAITSVIQTGSDEIIYGDEKSGAEYFRKGIHAGLIGFALGGGSGTVSAGMDKANKTKFYEYLATKSYKADRLKIKQKELEAQQDLENAPADKKEKFQKRLDSIKKKGDDLQAQLYDWFETTSKNDPKQIELMIEKIQEKHDALDIITGGKNYSNDVKEEAKKDFKDADEVIGDLFAVTDINYDSELELELSKFVKAAEEIDEANESLWFKSKDLKYEYVDTQEKFDELKKQYGKEIANEADGFFDVMEDGQKKIFINRDVAAAAGATNVIGHELLHYAISNRFANDPKLLRESIVSFKDYVKQLDNGEYILKSIESRLGNPKNGYAKLDENGKVQRDKDGLIVMKKEGYIEEYFTMFSDLIKTEKIEVAEAATAGIKNNFRTMVRGLGLGFNNVNFNSGKEVFDLLVDYNKNIGRTGLLSKITQKKAIESVAGKKSEKVEAGTSKSVSKDARPKTPEKLIREINNPKKTSAEKAVAEEQLTKQYDLLAIKALKYDTRKGDISRENVIAEARKYLPGILKRFNPNISNFSTFVTSNIAPKQAVIFESAKSEFYGDKTSTDTKEARQIEDTSSETTNTEDTFVQKINILQDFAIADRVANKIKALVKVVKGDNFKSIISKYAGKVGELIFEVPANKIMEGGANLAAVTKYTEGMPAPAEAQNIQRFFNAPNNADKFIKTLPLYNVTDKTADINKVGENLDVSRDTYGYAIGLKGLPLDYFYENYTDPTGEITSPKGRSKGLTSQTQVKRLKPQFRKPTPETVEQFKKDLGITPKNEANVYSRDIGQLLKGVAKVHSINAAISGAQRFQEAKTKAAPVTEQKAIKQQTADITAAQSKIAFSKSSELLSKYKLGELSNPLGIKLTPLIQIQKEGKDKIYTSQRDVDAQFTINGKETGKTYKETAAQALNMFLEKNPQFRDLIQKTMTGGVLRAGFFQTVEEFNKVVNKVTAEQETYAKDPYNKGKFLDKNFVKKTKEKGYKKGQDGKLPLLLDFFLAVEDHLKNNPLDIWVFEEMLKDTGKHQNTITRILAPITAYPVNQKGDAIYDQKVVEEHTNPQNQIGKALLANAQIGNTKEMWKVIGKSYMQLSLLKADDDLINDSGYQTSMPDIYYDEIVPRLLDGSLKLPDGLVSVVRLAESGIDLNNYYLINEGKTIAEFFGVEGMEVSRANEQVVKQLTGEVDIKFSKSLNKVNIKSQLKETKTLNKAIAFSRSANNETKGITVLDFDDTLATTKSGVRAKIPNPDGTPKPQRKVIFLAGGAGSGKGNVISKLGLKDQGFKIVNSDISLEWLKKNSGLPANMNDFTKEQRSKLGSLQHQARGIAKRKMTKYKGNADGVVVDGTGGSIKSMEKLVNEFKDKGYDVSMLFVETSLPVALERNADRKERSLLDKIVEKNHESVQGNKDGFKTMFGDRFMEVNTDNLSQQDAMPAKLTDKMNDFVSSYENRRLDAEEFASEGADILDQGGTFDFSEFNKVVEGQTAPLFEKAIKLQGKFGNKDMFVLTARPAESAQAIFEFLQANGLNIPIENITGLANSTPESKALWMADKVGEGYNDFYFADDALQNVQAVQNMLDQFDVKSKIQQAKVKFSKSMNDQFNDILENITGIDSEKRFSAIKGRKRGESKGKFRVFIPPSHEDFVGLLYNFLGKGKEGNAHRDFFEKALVRPLNRANREFDTARQSIANDYKELNKQFSEVKDKLTKKTPDGDFTFQDAIRVYLWDKHGHKIPGLSETDQTNLSELVMSDPQLQAYAETLNVISKQETYVNPTEGWNSGDIRMDLDDATGRVGRKQFFAEFIENADIIFSEENLNKIEAGYGKGVRESLEDMLYRIETGRNRPSGQNEQVNNLMNYLNGSVGTVMFFNMRSALLQQMSIVNYINFADNNIFAAAKAFANQKQYWKDFAFIFNSDMLKQRRGGIQTDINGAELAASLRNSKDITRKLISKLLELGFLPTQIGDNIAIATGGASYYRNRINKYIKQGMSQKEAEAAAFTDFQDITQSTQQSARPDMVSKQQASVIGKVILNFQNVTSQFNRLGKKAFQDIYNRRITKPNTTQMQSDISNAARITYYFAIQNAIFYTLQTALFAMMFDDDEEDVNNLFIKKKERLINGSIDSVLRGSGLIGGVVATLKNVAIAFARQRDVKYNPDESAVGLEALNLSPVLGIKLRKIVNAEKTLNYNKKVMKEMETFDIDNPQWSAATNYVEAFTNVPLNRLYNKTQNVRQSLNNDHAAWERTLMFLGWSQYNLDLENKKMKEIKKDIKKKTKSKKKSKKKKNRFGPRIL